MRIPSPQFCGPNFLCWHDSCDSTTRYRQNLACHPHYKNPGSAPANRETHTVMNWLSTNINQGESTTDHKNLYSTSLHLFFTFGKVYYMMRRTTKFRSGPGYRFLSLFLHLPGKNWERNCKYLECSVIDTPYRWNRSTSDFTKPIS